MHTSSRYRTLPTLITLLCATLLGCVARAQTPIPYISNGRATFEYSEAFPGVYGSPEPSPRALPQCTGPEVFLINPANPECSSGSCPAPSYRQVWPSPTVAPSYPLILPYGQAVQGQQVLPQPILSPTPRTFRYRTDLREGPTREQNRNDRWTFEGPLGRALRLFRPLRHRSQDCS